MYDDTFGTAVCDSCGNEWPCHLYMWGDPDDWTTCSACGYGRVFWYGFAYIPSRYREAS